MEMVGRVYNPALYRFGFNNQEKDNEIAGIGNLMSAEFWEYDGRLGRRWNRDQVVNAGISIYATFNNSPILNSDPNGAVPDGDKDAPQGSDGTASNSSTSNPQSRALLNNASSAQNSANSDVKKNVKDLTTSQKGIDFIKSYEGFGQKNDGKMYDDKTGNATIGYGHLIHYGKINGKDKSETNEFKKGITKERALEILKEDIKTKGEDIVRANVTVPLTQNQFDALVAFTFNTGKLAGSTLLKRVNAGDASVETIKKAFVMWNKGTINGKLVVIDGLTNRRAAESNIYNKNLYIDNK